MSEPGPYVIVPFLRPSGGGSGELRVRGVAGELGDVSVEVALPNGSVVARGVIAGLAGEGSSLGVLGDLFAVAECGAAHLSSESGVAFHVELRVSGSGGAGDGAFEFGAVDGSAGTEFHLLHSEPTERFAVLANGGDSELFVFVNDKQGPFIPPGGAARIQIPAAGGPLHVLIESGDGVLAYRGAPVAPDA